MKKSIAFVTASAACVALSVPAHAKKQPEVTGLALQQIQARDYEASKTVSFPAVMTVLQDSGYRISTADKDTGLITGMASTKSHVTWVPFVGFGRSKKTPVISAYIEDRGSGSRIRLNFVMAKTKNQAYGLGWSDEEPITDPSVYKTAFEKIEKEIFVRQALDAPTPKAQPTVAPAAVTSTPPASSAPVAAAPATSASTASASTSTSLTVNPPNMPPSFTPDPK